ncbi:thiamine pyrophosphate-dependent enzyme [Nonomuraea phyllanthi]|uniref:thiamine pyrophosphate-dependent enzyme n=1 Tax=Nonomuraea phyllanthi TaxID=2219224 RepID=UPI001D13FE83|nr:thiamine pyrophosphate-dependent enzyme [Nonomuraea phyllanthi]
MDMTGGEALARSLAANGVSQIFGIPGVQLDHAADALYHAGDDIAFTCVRNEQAATYMADGYARSTGRPGVAMVVPGPGMLNGLAGLATGYACSSPLLYVCGQIDSGAIGRGLGALHEIPDQSGILRTLTKWSGMAKRPEDIPGLVHRAFAELRSGRPRPVGLEIPPDVLAARADVQIPGAAPAAPAVPDQKPIDAVAEMLRGSRRPVIYAGGGVIAAGASEELRELAEILHAPVVMSENGRGAISARHRLAFDALAFRRLREDADVVLAVGTRFVTAFGGQVNTAGARLVLINAEAADLGEPRAPELGVHADARLALAALAEELRGADRESRVAEFDAVRAWLEEQYADIAPQRAYLKAIRSTLPDDGVLVSELTQIGYAGNVCFPVYRPRTYLTPGYQGTLGYGFATALGAKTAAPERPVVSVTGDGGFSWTLQELSTAKKYGLATVTVVFNDGYFGNVRRIQKNRFGARYFASDLVNPDYAKLADAFGIAAARASGPEELEAVLKEALTANEPVLVDAPVGEFPGPWHLIHEGVPRPAPLETS